MNFSVITTGFKFLIAGIAFLSTFYTVAHTTFFLSNPYYNMLSDVKGRTNFENILSIVKDLFIDMMLLSAFILQHSFMSHPNFKNFTIRVLLTFKIDSLQRCIYVLFTSLTLQFLMSFWRIIPSVTLWNYNFNNGPLWWAYVLLHSLAWTLIYICSIFMDVGELLGYKQVYYDAKKLCDPLNHKSQRLQVLYKHMRHPGFLLFLIIFWGVPVMSLDRLLLSTILSLYMYIAFRTDVSDYEYQRQQYLRKKNYLQ